MLPIVSVIIPNYNHSSFLKKRIESVLNQTFQDFEVIILDDCSTDNSRDIIEEYRSNPRINHIVYNEINSGSPFKQWKKGIQLAAGKYVWIAESDDYAEEIFLEKLVSELERNENAGLIFCNSHLINEQNEIIGNTNNWTDKYTQKQDENKMTFFNGYDFCRDHLFLLCRLPNASAIVFRREPVINNLFWIDDSLRNSGDWKLWLQLSLHSDLLWLNMDLNYYRQHSNNVTNSLEKNVKSEALKILKEIIADKSVKKHYRLFESCCYWSFNTVSWKKDPKYSIKNYHLYFKHNLSFFSFFSLMFFLFKQCCFFIKKICLL